MLGDPLDKYVLGIEAAGEEYRGLEESGVGYPPEELRVTCDSSKPVEQGRSKSLAYCSRDKP